MTSDTTIDVSLDRAGEKPTLRLVRRYSFSIAQVWTALTKPEQLDKWWVPMTVDLEPRPGGTITFTWSGSGDPEFGKVLEVEEPRLLAFTWGPDVLRWHLRSDGDGTVLVLTTTVEEPAHIAHSAAGWHSGLEMLDDVLAARAVHPPAEPAPPELVTHYRRQLSLD